MLLFDDYVFEAVLLMGIVAEHYLFTLEDIVIHIFLWHNRALVSVEPFDFFKPGVVEILVAVEV